MNQFILEKDYCPNCNTKLDAVTCTDGSDSLPRPGDISICFSCGTLLIFNNDLKLEKCPQEIFNSLDPDAKIMIEKAIKTITGLNN